jgi:hypothetical protein
MTDLEILVEALRRTGKRFAYCAPEVPNWMPALAFEIEAVMKERAESA